MILGAGPAGLACALNLARQGVTVAVIGQAARKGPKVGEFLPASVTRMARTLGLGRLEALLAPDAYLPCTAKMSAWGHDTWDFQDSLSDPEGGGWHILRDQFEAALLQQVQGRGINVHQAKLKELASNGAAFLVQTDDGAKIKGHCLVDATGRQAWAVRRLAGSPTRTSHQMAVVGWYSDASSDPARVTRIKSTRAGWWYTAPLPQQQRVIAFHGAAQDVRDLYQDENAFLASAEQSGVSDTPLKGLLSIAAPLHSCDAGVSLSPAVAGPRWFAIGDAALSFDPLSSQGMHFAMYSAIKASEAIVAGRTAADRGQAAAGRYSDQVSDVFAANQRARFLYYNQERRFPDSPYWQAQRDQFAVTTA